MSPPTTPGQLEQQRILGVQESETILSVTMRKIIAVIYNIKVYSTYAVITDPVYYTFEIKIIIEDTYFGHLSLTVASSQPHAHDAVATP